MKLLGVSAILFLLCGCMPMAVKAKRYSGDGEIRSCSNLLAQGYSITFPRFPIDQPYSASYRLAGVPSVGRDPVVYLSFPSNAPPSASDTARSRVTSTIRVTLQNSSGKEIRSLDLPLATAIWRWSQEVFGAYDLEKNVFHFDPSAAYTLHVTYTPGAVPPPAKEAYFEIDGCASY
jgi:hypothetical protein